ncbi:PmoA family protein [Rubinisphaera sp.]|uniref:DUF6807 domain-containing protein n=1 Tax=Rubinisphaera sp. TaxID=2024857 RepID=UPI000C0CE432|nr:PmoA family protein [Rubinisphaera sp.]MBV08195.1 hypothetical protein [Rubinisphaera sp.]HCS53111.1 hypothetical protein [Planctomycetaceae bacterium]|tara:strand:+ start:1495 stop:2727 length:1233 start_codon:yes stop_codon:yes gene_type:complete
MTFLSRFLLLTFLITSSVQAEDSLGQVTILSKNARAGHLLMTSEIKFDLPDGEYELRALDSDLKLSAQIFNHKLYVFLSVPWAARTEKRFEIVRKSPSPENEFHYREQDGNLEFLCGKRPVLTYNVTIDEPPTGANSLYRKSGYLHPVYSPAGHVLTDDFPADHYHQHGIFSAWVKTTIGTQEFDFWNQAKSEGTVLHERLRKRFTGSLTAGFDAELNHIRDPEKSPRTVLKETWEMRLHPHARYNIWELRTQQENVSNEVVTLNQYHYGGFAFRGRSDWLGTFEQSGCEMRTDHEESRESGNHTPARWVVISGPVDRVEGKSTARSGLVIMSHPENLRSPQKVRLHPNKPYFCFCPVVDEEFVIHSGDSLNSKYLVITFDGEISEKNLQEIWQEYSSSIEITPLKRIDE